MKTELEGIASRVVDLLMDVVCVVDLEGHFVYISASCEKVFGYTQEEMLGTNMLNYVHLEDRERTLAVASQIMRGNEQPYFENRYQRKDGRTVYIMWSARWSESDKVRVAVARDITEYKRYEQIQSAVYKLSQVAHHAADLTELYERGHDIIGRFIAAESYVVAMTEPRSNYVTLAYCVDGNYQSKSSIGLSKKNALGAVIRSGNAVLTHCIKNFALQTEVETDNETQMQGNWIGVPLRTQENVVGALVIRTSREDGYSRHDVKLMEFIAEQYAVTIERKEYEQKLHYIASHDWLTGLPNRLLFNDRLDVAIKRAKRVGEKLALFYMDLDGFKDINDSLGHAKGDALLNKVANRINACVRETDTVARMGGDEFTVLLTDIFESGALNIVLEKLRSEVNNPFDLDGTTVNIGISVGVAIYPEDGQDREQLLRVADSAMYGDKHLKIKKQHKLITEL